MLFGCERVCKSLVAKPQSPCFTSFEVDTQSFEDKFQFYIQNLFLGWNFVTSEWNLKLLVKFEMISGALGDRKLWCFIPISIWKLCYSKSVEYLRNLNILMSTRASCREKTTFCYYLEFSRRKCLATIYFESAR